MPNLDGTGPRNLGPLTGRGFGPCGRGQRRGFARGFSHRIIVPTAPTEAEQKKILEAELKEIEIEKQAIENRLKEMK